MTNEEIDKIDINSFVIGNGFIAAGTLANVVCNQPLKIRSAN